VKSSPTLKAKKETGDVLVQALFENHITASTGTEAENRGTPKEIIALLRENLCHPSFVFCDIQETLQLLQMRWLQEDQESEGEVFVTWLRVVNESYFHSLGDHPSTPASEIVQEARMIHFSLEILEHHSSEDFNLTQSQQDFLKGFSEFQSSFEAITGEALSVQRSHYSINACVGISCSNHGHCIERDVMEVDCICDNDFKGDFCQNFVGSEGSEGESSTSSQGVEEFSSALTIIAAVAGIIVAPGVALAVRRAKLARSRRKIRDFMERDDSDESPPAKDDIVQLMNNQEPHDEAVVDESVPAPALPSLPPLERNLQKLAASRSQEVFPKIFTPHAVVSPPPDLVLPDLFSSVSPLMRSPKSALQGEQSKSATALPEIRTISMVDDLDLNEIPTAVEELQNKIGLKRKNAKMADLTVCTPRQELQQSLNWSVFKKS